MANALAYYDTTTITAIKSFIVQAPGAATIMKKKSFMRLTPGGVGGSGKVEKGEADYGQASVEAAVASR